MSPTQKLPIATACLALAQQAAGAQDEAGRAQVEARIEHENFVALFIGGAQEGSRDNGIALGIEYERRLNARLGIGALLEHTFGDIDTWVLAIPFAYHTGPWKLYAGPGLEDGDEGTEALLRIGVEHGFEVGEWEIAPQIDVDFVDGEDTWVVGVTFAKGL